MWRPPTRSQRRFRLFSWSGCYVGGDVGGAWGSQGVLNTSPLAVAFPPVVLSQAPANTTATGGSVIGGGHIGCNYQWTPFLVIGVEGDFSGASLNATGHAQSLFGGAAAPGGSITWSSRLDSIATVRGRVGFAWTPNTLVYLTGGGAWGRTSYSSTDVFFFGCPACATTSFSNTSSGYVLGGGLEWAPWSNNWIVRAEYPLLQPRRRDWGWVRGRNSDRRGEPHLEQHGGVVGSRRPELQVLNGIAQ